jgi:hypothetical protein
MPTNIESSSSMESSYRYRWEDQRTSHSRPWGLFEVVESNGKSELIGWIIFPSFNI